MIPVPIQGFGFSVFGSPLEREQQNRKPGRRNQNGDHELNLGPGVQSGATACQVSDEPLFQGSAEAYDGDRGLVGADVGAGEHQVFVAKGGEVEDAVGGGALRVT